ncbi:hypothetical protein [Anaerosinus sp.]|uniref:hypothetical protein n=1 Tax=Selenobaculum sp. TaxID=3074374 RepID=UPI0015B1A9B5
MEKVWWVHISRIIKQYFISLIVAWGILYSYGKPSLTFGILVGELIGAVCIFIMGNRMLKSIDFSPDAAVFTMKIGWMIRLFLILGCLAAVIQISVSLFWAVVTGFFLAEVIMLANAVYWILKKNSDKQK